MALSIFCSHNWKQISKKTYNWQQVEVVKSTKHWYKPITEVKKYQEIIEILTCEKCGKIKKIIY